MKIFLTAVVLGSFLFTGTVYAQNATIIEGEVLRVDTNQMTVETENQGIQTFPLQSNFTIKRNYMSADSNDIGPGDNVTITQTSDGTIAAVEAVSNNFWLYIIGGVLALLIVLWLIKYVTQKSTEQHIKATPVAS